MLVILIILFSLYLLEKCQAAIARIDPKTKVLTDKKLIKKISVYLDNPYINLALVGRRQWELLREIVPGSILADRLGFPEASSITQFDRNANMLLNINRRDFLEKFIDLFSKNDDSDMNLSEIKRVILMGMFHHVMKEESVIFGKPLTNLKSILFSKLLLFGEFKAAQELFDRFSDLYFPATLTDEDLICSFFNQFPSINSVNLSRFSCVHAPGIFSYILESILLSLTDLKVILQQLNQVIDSSEWKADFSREMCERFELFLRKTSITASQDAYNSIGLILNWMHNLCHQSYFSKILFFRDMNIIRFHLSPETFDYTAIEKLINNWIIQHPCYAEIILIALLRNNSLLLAIKTLKKFKLTSKFSPHFKEVIRQHPNVVTHLDFDTHVRMHDYDYYEAFKTISIVSGPMSLFSSLMTCKYKDKSLMVLKLFNFDNLLRHNRFTREQVLSFLKKISSDCYSVDHFDIRFAFFKGLVLLLKEMSHESRQFLEPIPLQTYFFMDLLKMELSGRFRSFDVLKLAQSIGHCWKIGADALKLLFKLENVELFYLLLDNYEGIVSQLSVNLLQVVSIAGISTWTDKIFPLFRINHRTQFEKIDGKFWSSDMSVMDELDSVIDGNKPIALYINSPSAWTILPRLAFRCILTEIDASPLLKLWAKNSFHTFIVILPKSRILPLVERDVAVAKWLKQRPDDLEFNVQFAKTFLDDDKYNLDVKVETFDQIRELYKDIIPFLSLLIHCIQSPVSMIVNWDGVLASVNSTEEFYELVQMSTHQTLVKVFDNIPELKGKYSIYYRLLYDFDFIFNKQY